MADEIIITTGSEPEPEIEVEEVPEWASLLSSEIRESNSLQRETLELLRNQTNLLPQVMETNASLTSQLQRVPGEIIELVRPLLTPTPLVVMPLSDTPPLVEEGVPPVASAELPAAQETPSPRKKPRLI